MQFALPCRKYLLSTQLNIKPFHDFCDRTQDAYLQVQPHSVISVGQEHWLTYVNDDVCPTVIICLPPPHQGPWFASYGGTPLYGVDCVRFGVGGCAGVPATYSNWLWNLQLTLAVVYAGESGRPFPWPVIDAFQLKKTLGWTAVVFCACETIKLFSVLLCVVRAVHKCDFRHVMNETPNQ